VRVDYAMGTAVYLKRIFTLNTINMWLTKKQSIKIFTFKNVVDKLDNSSLAKLVQPEQKQYTTKEFNEWHKYIRKQVNKLSYDKRNTANSKQKA